jgi:hypothetical protein
MCSYVMAIAHFTEWLVLDAYGAIRKTEELGEILP